MKRELFEAFIEWRSIPKAERVIKNDTQWAKANGLSEQTVCRWGQKLKEQAENRDPNEFKTFMKHLKEIAFGGRATSRDRELYMKANGWLVEKREETLKVDYTPGERAKIAREVLEGLRANYKGGWCPVCNRGLSIEQPKELTTVQQ